MNSVITVLYQEGVLRPIEPLDLPENSQWTVEIIEERANPTDETAHARQVLREAGLLTAVLPSIVSHVSDEELREAARLLGAVGPLSEVVLRERDEL